MDAQTSRPTESFAARLGASLKGRCTRYALRDRQLVAANLLHKDNVAVFPRLGVIFNRVKKSGNTSVVAFLSDLEGSAGQSVHDLKREHRLTELTLAQTLALGRFHTIVVVRNPYTRAISGYLDKIASGSNPRYSAVQGFGSASPEGLETFLGRLSETRFLRDRHFYPQTRLLFQGIDEYSCVAKLETIVPDMTRFLRQIGQDPALAQSLSKPHSLEQKQAGKITLSAKKKSLLTDRSREIIRNLYAQDFADLGYNPDDI